MNQKIISIMLATLISATIFANVSIADDHEQIGIPDIENFPEPPKKPVNPIFVGGPDRKVDSQSKSVPNIEITSDVLCSTTPVWASGQIEKFYVEVTNEETSEKTVEIDFYTWDYDDSEYEWFDTAVIVIPAEDSETTDPDDADLLWHGGFGWICAKAYCDDYLCDTNEERFPW